jgi:inner membrane protein
MDSLTQIALGGAVGYAVMGNQVGRKAVLFGAALGTLPDLDVFLPYGGEVEAFTYHRGFSHSFIVHLLVSPLFAWLFHHYYRGKYLAGRPWSSSKKNNYNDKFYLTRWFWLVFLTLSSHALIDSFTVYGTQLMWPITEHPVGISNLFIIDPLYTLPLLFGLGFVLSKKLPSATTFKANNIGLVVSSIYVLWTLGAKIIIDQKVEIALNSQSIKATSYMSTPAPLNTLLWRVVVNTDKASEGAQSSYYEIYASIFDSPEEVSFYRYPSETELLRDIENEWAVQRLQWFTKGSYAVRQIDDNVVLSDLRMGAECAYVFNFNVGKITANGVELGDLEKTTIRPDASALSKIWNRISKPGTNMAPELPCPIPDNE